MAGGRWSWNYKRRGLQLLVAASVVICIGWALQAVFDVSTDDQTPIASALIGGAATLTVDGYEISVYRSLAKSEVAVDVACAGAVNGFRDTYTARGADSAALALDVDHERLCIAVGGDATYGGLRILVNEIDIPSTNVEEPGFVHEITLFRTGWRDRLGGGLSNILLGLALGVIATAFFHDWSRQPLRAVAATRAPQA